MAAFTEQNLKELHDSYLSGEISWQELFDTMGMDKGKYNWTKIPQISDWDWFRRNALALGHNITSSVPSADGGESSEGVPAVPGDVGFLETGDETIISGLPQFNQGLRNFISQLFTRGLAGATQGVVSGQPQDQILNTGLQDLFGEFLNPTLENLGIGPGITNPNTGSEPNPGSPDIDVAPDIAGGAGGRPRRRGSVQPLPSPAGPSQPAGGAAPSPAPLPGGFEEILALLPDRINQAVGGSGIQLPNFQNASPLSSGSMGTSRPYERSVGASPIAAGTAAALASAGASVGSLLKSLFGGSEPQQPAVVDTGSPFEPTFESPNSLASFMQLLQLFGPGGASSGPGASPTSAGVIGAQAPILIDPGGFDPNMKTDPAGTMGGSIPPPELFGMGGGGLQGQIDSALNSRGLDERIQSILGGGGFGGFGGGAQGGGETGGGADFSNAAIGDPGIQQEGFAGRTDNALSQIIDQFSLPGFGGSTFAGATPLQRQSTNFASSLLQSNPFADTQNVQNSLNQLVSTGGRFDLTPQFQALEGVTNRRLDERLAQQAEDFGSRGLRFGSDLASAQGQATGELLSQESLNRANIAQSAFENATNRRLQAIPLGEGLRSSALGSATQAYGLGADERAARERGIQRQMAEFARTQGGLFPLLLQFALAGTEGDTTIVEPR